MSDIKFYFNFEALLFLNQSTHFIDILMLKTSLVNQITFPSKI